MENGKAVPQKIKQLPYDPVNPLLGIDPKELKAESRDSYLDIHVHSSIKTVKEWKQPQVPITDK